jgi:thiol-disulfide isomerase/thioredoxin
MKNIINAMLFYVVLFSHSLLSGQAVTSNSGMAFFEGNFEELKAKASSENKLIFFDAYASWCGPCKRMIGETFVNSEVGEFYNTHFINYKLDMEKGEGPELRAKYGVTAYPTLFFLKPNGEIIHTIKGFFPAQDFIDEGKKIIYKKEDLSKLALQFEKGERGLDFLRNYTELLVVTGETNMEVYNAYIKALPKDYMTNQKELNTLYAGLGDLAGPFYKIYTEKKDSFIVRFSEKLINTKLERSSISNLKKSIAEKDINRFNTSLSILEKLPAVKDLQNKLFIFKHDFYEATGMWFEYGEACKGYLTAQQVSDPELQLRIINNLMSHSDQKDHLYIVKNNLMMILEHANNYMNNYKLALIHYKLNEIEDAKRIVKRSIAIGEALNQDVTDAKKLSGLINN